MASFSSAKIYSNKRPVEATFVSAHCDDKFIIYFEGCKFGTEGYGDLKKKFNSKPRGMIKARF